MNLKEKQDFVNDLSVKMSTNILSQFTDNENEYIPFPINPNEICDDCEEGKEVTYLAEAFVLASCNVIIKISDQKMSRIEAIGLMNRLLVQTIKRSTEIKAGLTKEVGIE